MSCYLMFGNRNRGMVGGLPWCISIRAIATSFKATFIKVDNRSVAALIVCQLLDKHLTFYFICLWVFKVSPRPSPLLDS